MTLRYVKTEKTTGFFTKDGRAGVTVISTLNSDGNPKAQNPSVNLVGIQGGARWTDLPAARVPRCEFAGAFSRFRKDFYEEYPAGALY